MRRRAIAMCLGLSVWCFLPNAEVPGQARVATADWLVWGRPDAGLPIACHRPGGIMACGGPPPRLDRAARRRLLGGRGRGQPALHDLLAAARPRDCPCARCGDGKDRLGADYETTVNQGGKEVGFGPYAMPQVIGDRVVTVGGTGRLHSLDKRTGKPVWSTICSRSSAATR